MKDLTIKKFFSVMTMPGQRAKLASGSRIKTGSAREGYPAERDLPCSISGTT